LAGTAPAVAEVGESIAVTSCADFLLALRNTSAIGRNFFTVLPHTSGLAKIGLKTKLLKLAI
jgi:hypothetical protein